MNILPRVYEFGDGNVNRPYYPLHTVRALELEPKIEKPLPISNPGMLAINGYLAGSSNGGAVLLAGHEWGSDFVAVEGDNSRIYLLPTDKNAIEVEEPESNVGNVTEEGVSILTANGQFVVTAIYTANYWIAENARQEGARVAHLGNLGNLWSIQPYTPMRGEIDDIDHSGITRAHLLPS